MIALLVGDADTSIDIQIVDDEGLPVTGLVSATFPTVKYSKGAGADATISTSDLSALTDAHSDGGVKERGEGVYRLDLPDAVATTAAPKVTIRGEATDKRIIAPPICVKSATRGFTGTAVPAAAADAAGGLPISDAGGLDLDAKLANTNEVTAARMGALTDWIDGGRLDLLLDATLADTNELQTDWADDGRLDLILDSADGFASTAASWSASTYIIVNSGTHGNAALRTLMLDVPTVAEFEARSLVAADYTIVSDLGTVQTGDSYARLGAPAGASVSADIAAVKTDTGNLVTRITSTIFANITSLAQWLGLIAGKQTPDATALTEIKATGAGSGTFDATTDSLQGMRDTAVNDTDLRGSRTVVRGTVTTGASTTSIPTSAFSPAGAVADQFKGRIVVFDNDTTTANLRGQASDITASTNSSTPTLTVTALAATPASGDTFSVV